VTGAPRACSGERYCAVPMIDPASVICEAPARAIPKSVTFRRSPPMRMLCGLTSRWMIPCRCAKRSASRISSVNAIACGIGSGPRVRMSSLRLRPSMTSMAM
jgi:hypothetical protein